MKRFAVVIVILSFLVIIVAPHQTFSGDPLKKPDEPSVTDKEKSDKPDKDKKEDKKDKDGDGYEECKNENKHSDKNKKPCDCNDADPKIHPDATEVCDNYGIDNDCNGNAFEPVGDSDNDSTPDCLDRCSSDPIKTAPGLCGCGVSDANVAVWHADADGDGFGSPDNVISACSMPQGHVADGTDCDDASTAINPHAVEACDAIDNNCDGRTDEGISGCVDGHLVDLPDDPVNVAPPADRTVATDFQAATAFLYAGNDPIQAGVVPGTIDDIHAAVVRGRVMARDGTPAYGVTITISHHPEYGSTKSREDGLFDIAVASEGDVVVRYERQGFLPVERRVAVKAFDYAWAEDVVMTPIDGNANAIDLNAPGAMQVASGSEVSDKDGTRRGVLFFPGGTTATMTLGDGTAQALDKMTVRITEYTVGDAGPAAMPAALPPASAYTYCVDLSVDEAIAAGAKGIAFDRPVIFYLENFLNFPVGFPIPLGYYDTEKAAWISADNGIVIKILSIENARAVISLSESGMPATAEVLANIGVADAELATLASRFAAGQTLWRIPIPHFTSWDANMGIWPPDDAAFAQVADPKKVGAELDNPCYADGSIIGCENQTLGEAIDVVGSGFDLYYTSSRAAGRSASNVLDIPVSGDALPASLKRIDIEIEVAGQRHTASLAAQPDQTYRFTWDGKDAYGRRLAGDQPVKVRIGYVYGAMYQRVPRFGYIGEGMVTTTPARDDVTLWSEWNGSVGNWENGSAGLGGLSLGVHHAYSPSARTLYLGDGSRRETKKLNSVIDSSAGGLRGLPEDQYPGYGDMANIPPVKATDVWFNVAPPYAVAAGNDGSVYLAGTWQQMIWKVDRAGIMTKFAGLPGLYIGNYEPGFSGDGGSATSAMLYHPEGVAADAQGNVYIADSYNHRIRKVDAKGIIRTIAGKGTWDWCGDRCIGGSGGYSGDGGPATGALLSYPTSIALDREGNVFFLDQTNIVYSTFVDGSVVRRIGLDGVITTVAGSNSSDYGLDGSLPATKVKLGIAGEIAVDLGGNIYIAERVPGVVRRISPDGRIKVIAGGGNDAVGENIPAIQAQLSGPYGLAVDGDGGVIVSENGGLRVRRIGADGKIRTIAGTRVQGSSGNGGLAIDAAMCGLHSVDVDSRGAIHLIDACMYGARKIRPMFPGIAHEDFVIASEDGSEVYHFDRFGRHLDTKDAVTGTVTYSFEYDGAGLLSSITDAGGNVTRIERDGGGKPAAIVAPFGSRTTLSVNAGDYLKSVRDPLGGEIGLEYSSGGLLSRFVDQNGHASAFTYDGLGFLARDTDAAGGFKTLVKNVDAVGSTVTVTSALNRREAYRLERSPTGAMRRVATSAAGLSVETKIAANEDQVITYADGTIIAEDVGPDPRFGMQSPVINGRTMRTPGGIVSAMMATHVTTLTDPDDLLSLSGETDTTTVNGRKYQSVYAALGRVWTDTSPEGRVVREVIDNAGRITELDVGDLTPSTFTYDNFGRLILVTQGARDYDLSYDASGFVNAATDAAGRTTSFAYDGAGRISTQRLPDGREIDYSYDAAGNVASITPPGRGAHSFGFSAVNLATLYDPPDIGINNDRTSYTYDLDRALTRITRPDGQAIDFIYDAGGRLNTINGNIAFAYDNAGRLATISGPGNESIDYTYDGSLPLSSTWHGDIAGTVSRAYDNNFWVTETRVNGAHAIGFTYDDDGLLTGAGNLVVSRDAADGLVTGTTIGNVSTSAAYNTYGETTSSDAAYAGNAIYSAALTRDILGRITDKIETIGGAQKRYSYTYDLAGRLTNATVDGQQTTYTYDANGNRLSKDGVNGAHDAQDRLISYGANTYDYTANGELKTKTAGGDVTTYAYDVLGNLRSVTLPDGTAIDYVIDGANRRVGKKVNGVLTRGWLYANQLNPIAELDGNGNVVSTFVYATKANVPDYIMKGGITYRIISDHLGSPRLIVNTATGAIAQRIDYDEFGIVTSDSSPDFQPFAFAGGLYDTQTKLVRFGARDYDAETGRWTSKDPIRFNGGDTNLYGYVENNPVNFLDSFGLFEITVNDLGGRNGAIYGGTMTVTGNNGQTVTVPVSSWPNPSNPSPGIQSGSYTGVYSPTGHQGTRNGVRVNNGGQVPTLGPNPAQGGLGYATGINIHCGDSATNRGSAGCITVSPSACQQVWNVLQPGESGRVQVNR